MVTHPRILLVAQSEAPPQFAVNALRDDGQSVVWTHVAGVDEITKILSLPSRPHLIICTNTDKDIRPLDVLTAVRSSPLSVPVVVLAENMTMGDAVILMKAGAENIIEMGDDFRLNEVISGIANGTTDDNEFDQMGDAVFHAARESIVVTDADNNILAVNAGFTATSGYEEFEVLGKKPELFASGREDSTFFKRMWDATQRKGHWEGEVWSRRKNGEVYPEWLSVSVMRDGDGRIVRHIAIYSDNSERKRDELALRHRAHHDPLTNLPNRALGLDRLAHALATAHRGRTMVSVMFVDLDAFKPVNDMFGHQAGDDLLCQVARRMETCIRESDTVYRFGGDEFVVILTDITSDSAATKVANNLLSALAVPFEIAKRSVAISASIGIAFYPTHGEEASALVRVADEAMYEAKRSGKNRSMTAPQKKTDAA